MNTPIKSTFATRASSRPVRAGFGNDDMLDHGAYRSKEQPKVMSENEWYDYEEDLADGKGKTPAAVLLSYDTRGSGMAFVWFKERPQQIVKLEGVDDMWKKMPKIFNGAGSAKCINSDSTGALYKGSNGFLAIAIDND